MTQTYRYDIPAWAPQPVTPADNPMSAAKVELGRRLFYDARLSSNGQMSCGTCHEQARAFTDGKATHSGVHGDPGIRNVMPLANVAYLPTLTWANPNLKRLEDQILVPLFGDRPVEMGLQGQEKALFATLAPRNLTMSAAFTAEEIFALMSAISGPSVGMNINLMRADTACALAPAWSDHAGGFVLAIDKSRDKAGLDATACRTSLSTQPAAIRADVAWSISDESSSLPLPVASSRWASA